jgi:uncharacterized membrane protein YphA (DoxX/SURF4 family)
MNIALWIVQGLLALAFLAAGSMKIMKSREEIIEGGQAYAEDFSDSVIKLIGALEIAAAIGLVLPMLLNILPVLTPLAGAGLAIVMAGAFVTHLRRGEVPPEEPSMIINTVLFALALFVAYGRFALVPVTG